MSAPDREEHDRAVASAVRRTVGIAALRKLRHMVDADAAAEARKSALATRLGWGFVLAAALALAWIAFR